MPNPARPAPVRVPVVRLAAVLMLTASGAAHAADLSGGRFSPYGGSAHVAGGGFWAPVLPVRPPPIRYDIYGYPIFGPSLPGPPAPHVLGVGCPLALQPAYDFDGNLAGYAPLQACR